MQMVTLHSRDMVPVSLTIPYPEVYIQKRLKCLQDVKIRETATVRWQKAPVQLEIDREIFRYCCDHSESKHLSGSVCFFYAENRRLAT